MIETMIPPKTTGNGSGSLPIGVTNAMTHAAATVNHLPVFNAMAPVHHPNIPATISIKNISTWKNSSSALK